MIDHISIAVRDIKAAEAFYTALLAPLGLTKLREWAHAAVGYGKTYPEFWINSRADMARSRPKAACISVCVRRQQRPSMRFMPPRLQVVGRPTASPAFVPSTMIAITPLSSATRTAIALKR